MQEIPSQIMSLCNKIMKGNSTEQQRNIVQAFLHSGNTEQIIRAATKSLSILICFRSLTLQSRRKGTYFSTNPNLFHQKNGLLRILDILGCTPSFKSRHENNLHLILVGQLIALLIYYTEDFYQLLKFIQIKLLQPEIDDWTKLNNCIKILMSCLQQFQILKSKYTLYQSRQIVTLRFIKNYSMAFLCYICQIGTRLCVKYKNQNDIYQLMINLLELQDSFLTAMQQNEKTYVFTMQWQPPLLTKLVYINTYFLRQSLHNFLKAPNQPSEQQIDLISKMGCLCLQISNIIYLICQSPVAQANAYFKKQLKTFIIQQFLLPFLQNFESFQYFNYQRFQLSQQFHVCVLKLILSKDQILQQMISHKSTPIYPKESQINIAQIQNTFAIKCMMNYCFFNISHSYFYFTDFQNCAIGLSIKLVHRLRYFVYDYVEKRGICNREELKIIQKHLKSMHQQFFQDFIMNITDKKLQFKQKEQQFYAQGKNWVEFIKSQLNEYFEDLCSYLPKLLSGQQLELSFFDQITKCIPQLDKKQNVIDEMQEKPVKSEQQIRNLCDDFIQKMVKQFTKDSSFRYIHFLIMSIHFQRIQPYSDFPYSQKQKLKNIEDGLVINQAKQQQSQFNADEYGDEDDSIDSTQQMFSQTFPMLSFVKSLISQAHNTEMRAQLFYQFYLIASEINIQDFVGDYEYKAKLIKLYIIGSFIQQIIPQQFCQVGQTASTTAIYLLKHRGMFIEELITQTVDSISQSINLCYIQSPSQPQVQRYALTILEQLCGKIVRRIYFLQDENTIIFSETIKTYIDKLDYIFSKILSYELVAPSSYEKMFYIAGQIIQFFGVQVIYDLYDSLINAIQFSYQNQSDQKLRNLQNFFASAKGLLEGTTKHIYFKTIAELVLMSITKFKEQDYFTITEDQLQWFLLFLNELICYKSYNQINNSLILLIYDVLKDEMNSCLYIGFQIKQLEKVCANICKNLAKLQLIQELPVLPKLDYSAVHKDMLDQYFKSINRVKLLDNIEPYATLHMHWFISFMQQKIQREQTYTPNFELIAINIQFKNKSSIKRLASIISEVTRQPIQSIISKMREKMQSVERILFTTSKEIQQKMPLFNIDAWE